MIEKTIKLYKFSELSEEVQDMLVEKYVEGMYDIPWLNEILESAEAFGKRIDVDFEFDSYDGYTYRSDGYKYLLDFEPEDMDGKRAIKWIYNNYVKDCYDTKYDKKEYRKKYVDKLKKIKYSAYPLDLHIEIEPCWLTGYCADYIPYKAYLDFVECVKQGKNLTLDDYFEMVQDAFADELNNEIEYQTSKECIGEILNDLGEIYSEDGREF